MIYAIGDVHGSLHMLNEVLALVKQDAKHSGVDRPRLVILGDYIDRGEYSKEIIDLFMSIGFNQDFDATILLGNHEDALLKSVAGNYSLFEKWLHWGGAETVESYGVQFGRDSLKKIFNLFRAAMPLAHIDFLKKRPLTHLHENWLFVHAGVRPSVHAALQKRNDLLWIGNDFLDHKDDLGVGAVVVHGHSVTATREVEIFANRIAIDTGAGFPNGKLSAVRLENGAVTKILSSQKAPGIAGPVPT